MCRSISFPGVCGLITGIIRLLEKYGLRFPPRFPAARRHNVSKTAAEVTRPPPSFRADGRPVSTKFSAETAMAAGT
jgi:hypothetical protein